MATEDMKRVLATLKKDNDVKLNYLRTNSESKFGDVRSEKSEIRTFKKKMAQHKEENVEGHNDDKDINLQPCSSKNGEQTDANAESESSNHQADGGDNRKNLRQLLCFMKDRRTLGKQGKPNKNPRRRFFKCFRLRKKTQEKHNIDVPDAVQSKSKFQKFIELFKKSGKKMKSSLTFDEIVKKHSTDDFEGIKHDKDVRSANNSCSEVEVKVDIDEPDLVEMGHPQNWVNLDSEEKVLHKSTSEVSLLTVSSVGSFSEIVHKESANMEKHRQKEKVQKEKNEAEVSGDILVVDTEVVCDSLEGGNQTKHEQRPVKVDDSTLTDLHTVIHSGKMCHCSIAQLEEVSFEAKFYQKLTASKCKISCREVISNDIASCDEEEADGENKEIPLHRCPSNTSLSTDEEEDDKKEALQELDEILLRAKQKKTQVQKYFDDKTGLEKSFYPIVENLRGNLCFNIEFPSRVAMNYLPQFCSPREKTPASQSDISGMTKSCLGNVSFHVDICEDEEKTKRMKQIQSTPHFTGSIREYYLQKNNIQKKWGKIDFGKTAVVRKTVQAIKEEKVCTKRLSLQQQQLVKLREKHCVVIERMTLHRSKRMSELQKEKNEDISNKGGENDGVHVEHIKCPFLKMGDAEDGRI